jgi:hypothetical protein
MVWGIIMQKGALMRSSMDICRFAILAAFLAAATAQAEPATNAPTGVTTNVQKTAAAPAPPEPPLTITNIYGDVFVNCKIKRTEPDGLYVLHSKGISKIKFREMPEELRLKYGYEKKSSQAFEAKQKAEQRAIKSRISQKWAEQKKEAEAAERKPAPPHYRAPRPAPPTRQQPDGPRKTY